MTPQDGNAMPDRTHGRIAENITHFARTLRRAGLPVGPASVVDAVRAVEVAGIRNRDDLYWTLHAVFVRKREHRAVFDEAFRIYWKSRGLVEKLLSILSPVAPPRGAPEPPKAAQTRVAQAFQATRERQQQQEKEELEVDARMTSSGREVLQRKDFAQMNTQEIQAAKAALRRMVLPIDKVRRRRLVAAPRGKIDLRRSIRASLRTGGDMIDLKRKRPDEKRPPIVALCDISGSMSQYTRILLHFLHALTEERRDVPHLPLRYATDQCHPQPQDEGPGRGAHGLHPRRGGLVGGNPHRDRACGLQPAMVAARSVRQSGCPARHRRA